jgi:hypothetical protein
VPERRHILLAPLDWGLGHATRCIPIIKELMDQGFDVTLASSGPQKFLLQSEFPRLRMLDLPGYDVRYGLTGLSTRLKIIGQIPKILIQIKRENRWLADLLTRETFHAVISDNRYGLHHPGLWSVFITHQLKIQSGFGKRADQLLAFIHYRYLLKFSCCWIPDLEKENSLGGLLSHPSRLPSMPVRYIGVLSRFKKLRSSGFLYDLLIMISGPEPQRSIWERKILEQLPKLKARVLLLRGLPDGPEIPQGPPQVLILNHLQTKDLNQALSEASLVMCRPGYSSLMELMAMGKKSILVPTPGQSEQEYLGGYLYERKRAFTVGQEDFDLASTLNGACAFDFKIPDLPVENLLKKAIEELGSKTLH